MVLRADQARIDQERAEGLTPFLFPDEDDHKSLLEAWQQADAVAEAGWKKSAACRKKKKEKRRWQQHGSLKHNAGKQEQE